jgi:hypothetical protein
MDSGQTVSTKSKVDFLPTQRFLPRRYRPGHLGNWSAHLPFAHDLIAVLRPRVLVELGTHFGESYFGFCQAVEQNGVACKCFAVDRWRGDQHSGTYDDSVFLEVNRYNAENYAWFSMLLRAEFDDVLPQFSDSSIDLLHVDGLHTYQAVRHDFFSWLPKLRPGGVVLLHDTMARHADFGVWRLWEELSEQFAHFEFHHSWGLGVLQVPGGADQTGFLRLLFGSDPDQQSFIRQYYALRGENLDLRYRASLNCVDPTPGKLTVFPCLQDGYSESTARSADLRPGLMERHALILPAGSRNGPIRLDPADSVCVVEIQRVSVCRAADSVMLADWAGPALVQLRVAGDLAPIAAGSTARYFSTGQDPQLYLPHLPVDLGDQPLLLEVWIRTIYDLRTLSGPLVPIEPGAMEMDFALKESRGRAAEMELQRNDAVSRNRVLEVELAASRGELSSLQETRDRAAEMELQRNDAVSGNRVLEAELAASRGELSSLQETRDRAAEMELQRNDAVSRNRILEAELVESHAELRRHQETRDRAAEMELQRNDAVSRNRVLEAELAESRAEVRSHQAERLALIADHRRNQTLLEVQLHESEVRLHEKEELDRTARVRLEQQIQTEHRLQQELREQYERERDNRTALLQSLSWRFTRPLRRLYEVLLWMRRPKS